MVKNWVLVADRSRAKILEKCGTSLKPIGPPIALEDITEFPDMDAAKPGKNTKGVFAPHTDLEDVMKTAFLREVAKRMNDKAHDLDSLVVCAPPEALGELRKHFSKHVLDKLEHEVPKELTKSHEDDIAKYVTKPYH
ncbi:MAG: host attachment protein [Alphaproteobacteria bacterium]